MQRQREEEAEILAGIDWHAFMVLDTVEFTAEDDGMYMHLFNHYRYLRDFNLERYGLSWWSGS